MDMSKAKAPAKRGRPPTQKIFSPQELRAKARENIQRCSERRHGIASLDVEDFCDETLNITRKHKFSKEELNDIRCKVDTLYKKFVEDKHEREAEYREPFLEALKGIDIQLSDGADSKMMTREEYYAELGLRPDGKQKPGPKKAKPKTIFDVELEAGEPIDADEIERQWLEHTIMKEKTEVKPMQGRRVDRYGWDIRDAFTKRQR